MKNLLLLLPLLLLVRFWVLFCVLVPVVLPPVPELPPSPSPSVRVMASLRICMAASTARYLRGREMKLRISEAPSSSSMSLPM